MALPRRAWADRRLASGVGLLGVLFIVMGLWARTHTARAPALHNGMHLAMLMVIHRHGDRTPVNHMVLPTDKGNPPIFKCDHHVHQTGADTQHTLSGPLFRKIYQHECPLGQLTALGCSQLRALGQLLGGRYGGLLPGRLGPDQIHLRATDYPRTQRSLECLLRGWDILDVDGAYDLHVHGPKKETMYPTRCAAFDQAVSSVMGSEQWRARSNEVGTGLASDLCKALGITSAQFDAMAKGGFGTGFDKYYDILHTRMVRGFGLPGAVDMGLYERTAREAAVEFGMLFGNREVLKLGIGRFLGELATVLESVPTQAPPTPRVHVYSGHDSTLMPVLTSLGAFDDTWPGYSSHVEIQVLRAPPSNDYWVGVLYRNSGVDGLGQMVRPVSLDWCEGREGLCPLDQFVARWRDLVPADYDTVCTR